MMPQIKNTLRNLGTERREVVAQGGVPLPIRCLRCQVTQGCCWIRPQRFPAPEHQTTTSTHEWSPN